MHRAIPCIPWQPDYLQAEVLRHTFKMMCSVLDEFAIYQDSGVDGSEYSWRACLVFPFILVFNVQLFISTRHTIVVSVVS